MRVTGACQCGAIRYEAEVDPQAIGICHCTDCQRLTGSAYRVTAPAISHSFQITAGVPRRYRKIGDSGQPSHQSWLGSALPYFLDIRDLERHKGS